MEQKKYRKQSENHGGQQKKQGPADTINRKTPFAGDISDTEAAPPEENAGKSGTAGREDSVHRADGVCPDEGADQRLWAGERKTTFPAGADTLQISGQDPDIEYAFSHVSDGQSALYDCGDLRSSDARRRVVLIRLSSWLTCTALLSLLFGVLYYRSSHDGRAYADMIAGAALGELTERVDELDALLREASSGAGRAGPVLAVQIGRASAAADAQLSRFPAEEDARRSIALFLSACDAFGITLTEEGFSPDGTSDNTAPDTDAAGGAGNTDEEGDGYAVYASALADYAQILSTALSALREQTDSGIAIRDAAAALTLPAPAFRPLLMQDGDDASPNGREEPDDAEGNRGENAGSHMKTVAAAVGEWNEDTLPLPLRVTPGSARKKALEYLGSSLSLRQEDAGGGIYRFVCENGFAEISRRNGRLLRFAVCKTIRNPSVSASAAMTAMKEFLEREGYSDCRPILSRAEGGVLRARFCTTLSTVSGSVFLTSRAITVGVSLDSGRICLFDASGYDDGPLPTLPARGILAREEAMTAAAAYGTPASARLMFRRFDSLPDGEDAELLVYEIAFSDRAYRLYLSACRQDHAAAGETVRLITGGTITDELF